MFGTSKQKSHEDEGQPPAPEPVAQPQALTGEIKVIGGPHTGLTYPLVVGATRIGRKADNACSIVLDQDKQVSGFHGIVFLMPDGEMYFEDRSTYGSVVNGSHINNEERVLHSDSLIDIGGSRLQITLKNQPKLPQPFSYHHGPAADKTSDGQTPPRSGTGSAVLSKNAEPDLDATVVSMKAGFELASGIDEGARIPIQRAKLVLGRKDSDIELFDDTVSRQHAILTMQGRVFWLTDNGSTHGTYINGIRLGQTNQQLYDGDYIRFGARETTLIFRQG